MPHPVRDSLLDWIAKIVTRRRVAVLVPLAVVATVLGAQIPSLRVDPTPERLLASYEGRDDRAATDFHLTFGATDKVLLVLLRAEDVLAPRNVQYLHRLSLHFRSQEWVERAESVTVIPIPHTKAWVEDEGGLDELEGTLADDIDAALDPEAGAALDALNALVDAEPARFPDGLGGLASRMRGEISTDPIITGEDVTEAEATALRRALDDAPLVTGRLISADRSVAVVALQLAGRDIGHRELRRFVRETEQFITDNAPPEGAEVHLGGLPYIRTSIVESMRSDQLRLVPLTLLVCALLLFFSFRWLPGVLLPIGAVGISAIVVVGGMAALGEPMNILNNIIPPLLIIIGISDSIHLVGRYREELARTSDRLEADRNTVRTMAVATLLTSVTTAVGLASLVVSQTEMLRRFGLTAAIGVMVAYVVTILFVPSVLTAVRPPPQRKAGRSIVEALIVQLTRGVLRHRWTVLFMSAVLLGASVWAAGRLKVDHALLDQFDEEDPVYQTTRLLEDELDGIRPLEVSFRGQGEGAFLEPAVLDSLDEILAWARKQPEVAGAYGPTQILHETYYLATGDGDVRTQPFVSRAQVDALVTLVSQRDPNPLTGFFTADRSRARLQIKVRDIGAQATLDFVHRLEGVLERELSGTPGIDFSFGGDAYVGSRGLEAVVHDLRDSLLTAVAIIFVLLSVLFRSPRLGLLSIPPNVIPLAVTMAYMVLRGIPLNAATVIIFSISIGLAVDGTIHVLARYREETLSGLGSTDALLRAARGTGKAIFVSSMTLVLGFAVLLASSFVPVRQFGELIAITVLSSLFATLIVQPALLKVAGLPRRREVEVSTV